LYRESNILNGQTAIICATRNSRVRLNSAIGYITPKDILGGHQQDIQAERDRKLEAAKGTAEESARRVTDETDYLRLADHPPTMRLSSVAPSAHCSP
jgi:hypothetical protein